jgi:mono/diheme cytochrome c family protein
MAFSTKKAFVLAPIFALLMWSNCKRDTPELLPNGASKIEATAQRNGDATAGRNYLLNGDYLSSGIPLDIFKIVFGTSTDDLGRTGDNQSIAYNSTVTTHPNGTKVVALNCMSCHADRLPDGKIYIGLGNTTADNTVDVSGQFNLLDLAVQNRYGTNSKEWAAYLPFSRGFKSIAPFIKTDTRGVSPADKIFAALSAFRDANNLTWLNQPQFTIPTKVIPSDVPAWWLMKKKNAIYYNALGVGDFGRLSTASALVTMVDSAEARKIDARFPDVMAYLRSITPPQYPNAVDQTLVTKGKTIFEANCSKCHGTYGANSTYPNLLIDQKEIGTDPALANVYSETPDYHNWYNRSWFSKEPNKAQLLPTKGYIAPPLDGIWATAPYLHNGSVPTVEEVLNSSQRPAKWSRSFDNKADFDPVKLGWKYKVEASKSSVSVYDTSLQGYGNGGHVYGDKLTADERKAVIEYLKIL